MVAGPAGALGDEQLDSPGDLVVFSRPDPRTRRQPPWEVHVTVSSEPSRHLTILSRSAGAEIDGINDHAVALAAAVTRKEGWQARSVNLDRDRPLDLLAALPIARTSPETLLLQYNPFSFGRLGLAPWLPLALTSLRRRCPSLVLSVLVHEPYVRASSMKWALLHAGQRTQLRAVIRMADICMATTREWAEMLPSGTSILPVGSNLPDRRSERNAARARLGAGKETVIVAAFGTNHPGRNMSWVEAGFRSAQQALGDVTALNLGAGAPALSGIRNCITPGRLDPVALADHLAAADIFLAPFLDGISTRRTTVMAALQHGLPVIGTRGRATGEPFLHSDGLILVDGSRLGFADATLRLASRRPEWESRGRAARCLYDRYFAWDVLADRLTQILGNVAD